MSGEASKLYTDCLKDLQRFLRQDDPVRREAFFALGKYGVVKSDLVSLIVTYPEDTELVYNACAPPSALVSAVLVRPQRPPQQHQRHHQVLSALAKPLHPAATRRMLTPKPAAQ